VNAGVCPAGADDPYGLAKDLLERLGENALDSGQAGLDLPAVERRAVVTDG
jgi:hypothetical protein